MKDFISSLGGLWRQLGLNQRVSLIVAIVGVIAGMTALVVWSRRPDMQLLYGGMGEKDAAAVISYLESQNIPHQVTAGGTAVQVPTDQVYKLRMDLASKGLPSGDGVGFEIFDKGQFGLSDFVQRTNYVRAVQGELSRTITQLAGVQAARVMIVQPENRLLLTEQGVKPSASVFVDTGGRSLKLDQVNAIRYLVARSVQGLKVDDVSVVDNQGHVLSEGLEQDPMLATASSQMRYRQQVEDYLSHKVESMLAQVIGPGQAVVRVSAEIETEATTLTQEKYDPEGQVVRSQTDTEDASNTTELRSSGSVGVAANVPDGQPAEGAARPTSQTDQKRRNRTTTYEINRVTTNVTRAPGTVKSITAAVFVAERAAPAAPAANGAPAGEPQPVKRTPEEIQALRQVVINALGIHPADGESLDNVITVQEVPFATPEPIQQLEQLSTEHRWQTWVELARRWGAVAAAALVLFLFYRGLKRQSPEPLPVEVLALSPEEIARKVAKPGIVTPEMLNELIRQKPANIGTALRDWVAAGANGGGKN